MNLNFRKLLLFVGPISILVFVAALHNLRTPTTGGAAPPPPTPEKFAEENFEPSGEFDRRSPQCIPDPESFSLFRDSESLRRAEVQIHIAELTDDGILGIKFCETPNQPLFAIGSTGLKALIANPVQSEDRLPWGCAGEETPALKFGFGKDKQGIAPLIALGKKAPEILKWHPAEVLELTTVCKTPLEDFQQSSLRVYRIADLPFRYTLIDWKNKITEESCEPGMLSLVNQLNLLQERSCELQRESRLDCFGLSAPRSESEDQASEVLGVLSIQNENWIVLRTLGYEWMSFEVAPLDSKGRIQKSRRQIITYSGC